MLPEQQVEGTPTSCAACEVQCITWVGNSSSCGKQCTHQGWGGPGSGFGAGIHGGELVEQPQSRARHLVRRTGGSPAACGWSAITSCDGNMPSCHVQFRFACNKSLHCVFVCMKSSSMVIDGPEVSCRGNYRVEC